jgi:hypothetical protein
MFALAIHQAAISEAHRLATPLFLFSTQLCVSGLKVRDFRLGTSLETDVPAFNVFAA